MDPLLLDFDGRPQLADWVFRFSSLLDLVWLLSGAK